MKKKTIHTIHSLIPVTIYGLFGLFLMSGVAITEVAASVMAGCGTAVIDGSVSSGEYTGAGTINFSANVPEGGTVPAETLVMNDNDNLYLALRVSRSSLDIYTHTNYLFDNDNDGYGEDGDDFLAVYYPGPSPYFTDAFYSPTFDPPSLTFNDLSRGGTVDGSGAVSNNGTYTVLELSHPLNSSDDSNDFNLTYGDTVGMTFTLTIRGSVFPPYYQTRVPTLPTIFTEVTINNCIIQVSIDIKPDSTENTINLSSAGVIPVAIMGSDSLSVSDINPATIRLSGASVMMVGKSGKYSCHEYDINSDSYNDLVCQVYTAGFLIEPGETTAVLEAETYGGDSLRGEDSVRFVPD